MKLTIFLLICTFVSYCFCIFCKENNDCLYSNKISINCILNYTCINNECNYQFKENGSKCSNSKCNTNDINKIIEYNIYTCTNKGFCATSKTSCGFGCNGYCYDDFSNKKYKGCGVKNTCTKDEVCTQEGCVLSTSYIFLIITVSFLLIAGIGGAILIRIHNFKRENSDYVEIN